MGRKRSTLLVRPGAPLFFLVVIAGAGVGLWLWHERQIYRRTHAYDELIWDAAQRHQVSPFLVKAIIWKESRFRRFAVGTKGEVGLMQITDVAVAEWHKGTGHRLPCRGIRFCPRLNIEIGTWYLAWAAKHWRRYRSADQLTLAEYNAGYGNVIKNKWVPQSPQQPVALRNISFPGTRQYIRDILMKWHQFEKEHSQREQ